MFNIVVITPEINHPLEAQILSALVLDHDCIIHIRKPHFGINEYKEYLLKNDKLTTQFVLHEHHSLAKEFPVKGIHLKEKDKNQVTDYPINIKIISTSLHVVEDANKLKYPFEYVFFSPLFESISKQNYGSNTTQEMLKETVLGLKHNTKIPIIGLGGINKENIVWVKNSRFDGAAILGAIWQSEDPLKTFEEIASKVQEF